MKKLALIGMLAIGSFAAQAQGTLSGNLTSNVNFYNRDSSINAMGNPLYNNLMSGGETWMSLRYNNNGFTATLRADAFHNSNLYNPGEPITGYGIGAWTLSKEMDNMTITAGYIYDQIGSGILFRAYEDRGLLIDNALVGIHLKYKIDDHINLKMFTGQQKNVKTFARYEPVIKGLNVEGDYQLGNVHINPGFGALNRTMDQESMNAIVAKINSYELKDRFVPTYNTYAFTFYNTLTAGDFSWYAEGAYKTAEAIKGAILDDKLVNNEGSVFYSTLGYAKKGIAINLNAKRTENFVLRTSPNEILNRGMMNWQPVVARMRPQRLLARYTPASQDISEMAIGGDVLISPNDNLDITLNYTDIKTLDNTALYNEIYGEFNYRGVDNWQFQLGLQLLKYNQSLYQVKPNVPTVNAVTPFTEIVYKINDKQSIRTEWEYMSTEQDFGSWAFGLVEFTIAPKWSFAVSDMYITSLNKENPAGVTSQNHFYNFFTSFTKGANRFTLAYVKQVEGINCTGGVCRYEPAFSGLKFSVNSSF